MTTLKLNEQPQFNKLPKKVNQILYSADDTKDIYQESIRIKSELKSIGWSVDYDLAGEVHLLTKD